MYVHAGPTSGSTNSHPPNNKPMVSNQINMNRIEASSKHTRNNKAHEHSERHKHFQTHLPPMHRKSGLCKRCRRRRSECAQYRVSLAASTRRSIARATRRRSCASNARKQPARPRHASCDPPTRGCLPAPPNRGDVDDHRAIPNGLYIPSLCITTNVLRRVHRVAHDEQVQLVPAADIPNVAFPQLVLDGRSAGKGQQGGDRGTRKCPGSKRVVLPVQSNLAPITPNSMRHNAELYRIAPHALRARTRSCVGRGCTEALIRPSKRVRAQGPTLIYICAMNNIKRA